MSNIEEDIMSEEAFNELIDNFEIVGTLTEYGRKAIKQNVKKLQKRIKELEEYIDIAPNLDKMTATKYVNIQREAYVKGRAEEQQKAEKIINNYYIPRQKVKDILKELKKEYEIALEENSTKAFILKCKISALEELRKILINDYGAEKFWKLIDGGKNE